MFYPKEKEARNPGAVRIELISSLTGFAACLLMVFLLCYSLILCMEIPVSFSQGQFILYIVLEVVLAALLFVKFYTDSRVSYRNRFSYLLFLFSLLTCLIWTLILIHDIRVMSDPYEAEFRLRVFLMDISGLLTTLAAAVIQLMILIRSFRQRDPNTK